MKTFKVASFAALVLAIGIDVNASSVLCFKNHYILEDPACAAPLQTSTVGTLIYARGGPSATLLPDGRLLVAGGLDWAGAVSSAELFDVVTMTSTLTGSMHQRRGGFTANLLSAGKVLVAGGTIPDPDPDGYVLSTNSTELFDAATGLWSVGAPMSAARDKHTATLLENGKILVAGGRNYGALGGNDGVLGSAEFYDPTTGTWIPTGSLAVTRDDHTATLLQDGRVLVAGGESRYIDGQSVVTASAELYDPLAGAWQRVGDMQTPRSGHTATRLPDGRVLVVGGWGVETIEPLASAELFDPARNTWNPTGSLNEPRGAHQATLLPNGMVLVAAGAAGGFNSPTLPYAVASTEVYDPATGAWTKTMDLNQGRYWPGLTLLADGTVLVVGGLNIIGTTPTFYLPMPLNDVELLQGLQ